MDSPDPQPSATVVLLRQGAGPEVLLVQRSPHLAFHGGAWVFPGGRVEPKDATGDRFDEVGTARLAAVREVCEETGLCLAPEALVPLSRWTTPPGRPRRFRTWFFLGEARAQEVRVDGGEIRDHVWMAPRAALALHAKGEMDLPPPTFVTLTGLLHHGSVSEALAARRGRDPEVFTPRPMAVEGGLCSLYEGDVAYDDGDLARPGTRHRLWLVGRRWRYERDPAPFRREP